MLKIPPAIKEANSGGPVAFKWDEKISSKFAFDEELDTRLATAADACNYRTNIILGICTFEWFLRRFDELVDLSDAYLRLEAAYACAINPHYLDKEEFNKIELGFSQDFSPNQVINVGSYRVWEILKICIGAQLGIAGECVNLFLITSHVMPNSAPFENWLEAAFRKGAKYFPREVASYDTQNNFYNYGVEKIVPREFFFDPDFKYSDESAMDVLQAFLDTLDPETNPYLNTADEMKAEGYTRTPYKMLDLKKG